MSSSKAQSERFHLDVDWLETALEIAADEPTLPDMRRREWEPRQVAGLAARLTADETLDYYSDTCPYLHIDAYDRDELQGTDWVAAWREAVLDDWDDGTEPDEVPEWVKAWRQ